eukprot:359932-Chlamydomonas_euryale.AAC.1
MARVVGLSQNLVEIVPTVCGQLFKGSLVKLGFVRLGEQKAWCLERKIISPEQMQPGQKPQELIARSVRQTSLPCKQT